MIPKADVQTAIRTLGLSGSPVCVHASIGSLGDWLEGGLPGLIQSFLGEGCTLLAPSFSDQFQAPPERPYMPLQNGAGDYSFFQNQSYGETIFSPQSNDICLEEMGLFSQAVLHHPRRIRGNHPLNSFTALGPQASRLAKPQTPREVYAPLAQLCHLNGFVLLLGVTLTRATILHFAEQLAGRTPFVRWARNQKGQVIPVSVGGCSEGFMNLHKHVLPLEKTVVVGKSLWRSYPAKDMAKICQKAIEANPSITHCGDPNCDRCNDGIKGGPLIAPGFWEGRQAPFVPSKNLAGAEDQKS